MYKSHAASLSGREIGGEIGYKKGSRPTSGGFFDAGNASGGITGGISTGEEIVVRLAVKPIPTITPGKRTVDLATKRPVSAASERHDTTCVPALSVAAENAIALPIARAFLAKFGGDTIGETRANYGNFIDNLQRL